jgi:hypothetical protein
MRDCSASAWRIACRIHQTAYEMNADQAEVPLVDQVGEGDALVLVLLGDGDDEAKVRAHELVERLPFPGADALRQADLLIAVDERVRADVAKILVERPFFVRRLLVGRHCHADGGSSAQLARPPVLHAEHGGATSGWPITGCKIEVESRSLSGYAHPNGTNGCA